MEKKNPRQEITTNKTSCENEEPWKIRIPRQERGTDRITCDEQPWKRTMRLLEEMTCF